MKKSVKHSDPTEIKKNLQKAIQKFDKLAKENKKSIAQSKRIVEKIKQFK